MIGDDDINAVRVGALDDRAAVGPGDVAAVQALDEAPWLDPGEERIRTAQAEASKP